jgi:hypothetical protein
VPGVESVDIGDGLEGGDEFLPVCIGDEHGEGESIDGLGVDSGLVCFRA